MTETNLSSTFKDPIKRTVCLKGMAPVMFDRYPGDNSTQLDWWQKVYQAPGSNIVSLPTMNIVSLLSSHNTNSAPKRLRDKRKYKDIANACLSFVMIESKDDSQFIHFLRDGKPITMGSISQEDRDKVSGIYLHTAVARLDKGIPNPKRRPVLPLPWSLEFCLTILPNREIKEQEVRNLIAEAGMAIGIGTFRGVFGKYVIDKWA